MIKPVTSTSVATKGADAFAVYPIVVQATGANARPILQMREDLFERAAVFFLQPLDRDEALLDLIEPRGIETDRLGEPSQGARGFLRAVQRFLKFADEQLDVFDVLRERLQKMQCAADLCDRRVLVFVDDLEGARSCLDHLARVAQHRFLGAQ